MNIGLLGQKVGMTRVYDESGTVVPVTVVLAEPNTVVQVKSQETDGYRAVQVGHGEMRPSRVSKPLLGHFQKSDIEPRRNLREFRLGDGDEEPTLGQDLTVTHFEAGQYVDVIGLSKGKGFQGVMRRHGFHGQPASHGSKMHRRPGSIGQGSTPGQTRKNAKLPGHMGNKRVTVQNLLVVQVRQDENVLLIRGAIPGPNGSLIVVRSAIKGQPGTAKQETAKSKNPLKQSKAGLKGR
jgi:large subunit ribosomal protein L3